MNQRTKIAGILVILAVGVAAWVGVAFRPPYRDPILEQMQEDIHKRERIEKLTEGMNCQQLGQFAVRYPAGEVQTCDDILASNRAFDQFLDRYAGWILAAGVFAMGSAASMLLRITEKLVLWIGWFAALWLKRKYPAAGQHST